ncbi:leucine-rich repeat protein kinase family protein [Actinidia rufa]|uniref:Leucine-rich repeat protein kinase family protein n=1 Tax=Actinidia rufa TaxID=165716 RepID=A0A7J0E131_9ERIC|nr:leucine-rich repeat protein kinase family protein [Actinidia rufa]
MSLPPPLPCMVFRAMGVWENTCGTQISCFAIFTLVLGSQGCWSLNSEGWVLLEFSASVDDDPYGTFANWEANDNDPCMWDLNGLSLEGELASGVGKISLSIARPVVSTIGPWKSGLSGQLQKAFVTAGAMDDSCIGSFSSDRKPQTARLFSLLNVAGVPKLNRAELETNCEYFSNIVGTLDCCTVYKGTLSSGVKTAVASTVISSARLVKALGTHLPEEGKELEHLDWSTRIRIIMGTAYCLQYMHELNPPVAHSNLISNAIFFTNDYRLQRSVFGQSLLPGPDCRGKMNWNIQNCLPFLMLKPVLEYCCSKSFLGNSRTPKNKDLW